MALVQRLLLDLSLAMFLTPTSTTHLLSRSTTLAGATLATLLVHRRIGLIAETTVMINVMEGASVLYLKSVELKLT